METLAWKYKRSAAIKSAWLEGCGLLFGNARHKYFDYLLLSHDTLSLADTNDRKHNDTYMQ